MNYVVNITFEKATNFNAVTTTKTGEGLVRLDEKNGMYKTGELVTIMPLAAKGYTLKSVKAGDVAVTEDNGFYTFTMSAKAVAVAVVFEKDAPVVAPVKPGEVTKPEAKPVAKVVKLAKAKATAKKVTRKGKKAVKISYAKVKKAQGYVIHKATKKAGKYTILKKVKGAKAGSFVDTKVKKGKNYFYKVKAFVKDKTTKKTVYSAYSKLVKVKF